MRADGSGDFEGQLPEARRNTHAGRWRRSPDHTITRSPDQAIER